MTEEVVMQLGKEAIRTTAMLAAPMLVSSLVVGVAVSVVQALTQVNEATLSFIPKLIILGIVLIIAGPWMMDIMMNYTTTLFENISTIVRE